MILTENFMYRLLQDCLEPLVAFWIRRLTVDLPKNSLDPGDNLVTGWVGGLIKVNDTRADIGLNITLQW